MSHCSILDPYVLHFVQNLAKKKVLDCGSGLGRWGNSIRSRIGGDGAYIIGVDLHKPYLEFCKRFGGYDELILADLNFLPFKDYSFDLVIACEVIEHLERKKGEAFLNDLEKICKSKIILTTPNGFWPSEEPKVSQIDSQLLHPIYSHYYSDTHISAYYAKDFKKRGYDIWGLGFRWVKFCKMRSRSIWAFFYHIFTPISWIIPELGEFLIAVKHKRRVYATN